MDRKKTILIAVIINACLLVVLFIMALHQDEALLKPAEHFTLAQERGPLFPDFQVEEPVLLAASEQSVPSKEAVIQPLHQLPPLAAVQSALPPAIEPSLPAAARALAEVMVKKGDTLEKIAKLNQTSVDEIIRLNQLSSSFLRIGQVLKLPEKNIAAAQKPLPIDKRPLENAQQEYYTVKVGDNPWTIAMKHHLKVDELLKINNLNEEKARRLKPGDRLRIR